MTATDEFLFLSVVINHPYMAFYLAVAILACMIFPVLMFLLLLFLLTGPVIAGHHSALEANNGYEQN